MSAYAITTGRHPDDGVLLALLDGAIASPEDVKAHADSCAVCDDRLAELRRASDLLRASLPPIAMPPGIAARISRPKRRTFTYPILAAASVLLIASVATATPIRHWIIRQFAPPKPEPATTTAPPPVPSASRASGIIASFAATDTLLVIRIDARQQSGILELAAGSGDRISAQAVSGAAAEELMVLPGQLRIVNAASSTADYRVTIPATVRTISVQVAGAQGAIVHNSPGLSRRIPLR